MTSRLQDGEPLTYELFNQMLDDIEQLKKNQKANGDQDQRIEVSGQTNPKAGKYADLDGSNILIRAGVVSFNPEEVRGNLRKIVHFGKGNKSIGFNGNPIVVACLADDDDDKKTPYANIIVAKVTTTGFTLKVNLLSKIEDETEIIVNYIAIGAYDRKLKA